MPMKNTASFNLTGALGHSLAESTCRSQDNRGIKASTKRYEFRALEDEGIISSGTVDIWLCTGLSMQEVPVCEKAQKRQRQNADAFTL